MCGIFGIIADRQADYGDLVFLAGHARQRGKDSSGLMLLDQQGYTVEKADYDIEKLLREVSPVSSPVTLGHSRLITNGLSDNQPVMRDGVCVFHNGIIVNEDSVWAQLDKERALTIDSETIAAIVADRLEKGDRLVSIPQIVLDLCRGIVSCAVVVPRLGKLCLFSNNGSLFSGKKHDAVYFSSERYPLECLGCNEVHQVYEAEFIDVPESNVDIGNRERVVREENLIPGLVLKSDEEKILEYPAPALRRCTRCILPETMPYIDFDKSGVCNYCRNYTRRNVPKPTEELVELVKPYRKAEGAECIIPFSGGRDSCYGLHLVVNELGLKPITYTYEWGMVTDLGRRNISRMCAELGVENIIVADDISKKRDNIRRNIRAWLKSPNLGMVSIFTAGDKHFFRYVERVKRQTGVNLNLWGINPLEVTHFKAGFLGIPPDFAEKRVYSSGGIKQIRYQYKRLWAMLNSPGYFNRSLFDTLSGEYYRSFSKKTDYFHIFDYWRWDEQTIEETLDQYDWERAPDTQTTWRIGDGTAAFYNYIYYTVAGFTEHDTFRSNQIREGQISRERALELVQNENVPRYPNIKWYLDVVGLDFSETIRAINKIPRLYEYGRNGVE